MRILFLVGTFGMLRHFDTVVETLHDRGHDITLAVTERGETSYELPRTLEQGPRLRRIGAPAHRGERFRLTTRILRSLRDCHLYQTPAYQDAHALRRRAFDRMLEVTSGGTQNLPDDPTATWLALTDEQRGRLSGFFAAVEDLVPSEPLFEQFLLACRPDIVLITPLVHLGSNHPDYVKAAKKLGIPTGFPVFSWDNLSSKGALHVTPDRMFVWNETQKAEAVNLHGVDPASVVVTGASRFDKFFEMTPSVDRESFCQRYDLDPARAIVCYLGSSPFVAPDERGFVRDWIRALRSSSNSRLAGAGVIIRPHPRSLSQWEGTKMPPVEDAGVRLVTSRRMDSEPLLYDCLFHADAVVALNTSAQLEAAILGKPIFTVLAPGSAPGQVESLHFRYLLRGEGGCVEVAADLSEHVQQLGRALDGEYDRGRVRDFTTRFIRPHGLDRPVTPIVADAFEALGELAAPRQPGSLRGTVRGFARDVAERLAGPRPDTEAQDTPAMVLMDPVESRRLRRDHAEVKELRREVRRLKRHLAQVKQRAGVAGLPDEPAGE